MRLVFFGTPDFAVPSLYKLYRRGHVIFAVVTQPDRPRGRGKKIMPSPVKEAAKGLKLDIWQPEKVKTEEFMEGLSQIKPQVIVTVAFGQILPEKLLRIPPLGCINVHASLLPKYRGAAPIHRAIINGEKETGVTTMYMDKGMDTGDIILQRRTDIPPEMTAGQLHDKLALMGAELLCDTLELIEEGKAPRRPQEEKLASYAPPLSRKDEVIKWEESSINIINRIRGMNPWPGTYSILEGRHIKIREVSPFPQKPKDKKFKNVLPGEVIELVPDNGFLVAAGDGYAVKVLSVQPAGKKYMSASEFLRGYRLKKGDRFGK